MTQEAAGAAQEGRNEVDPWVTLREASERTGVSVSALRRWRNVGDIPSRMEPGPTGDRIVVPLTAVLDRAGHARPVSPPIEQLADAVPEGYRLVPVELVDQVEALLAQAAAALDAGERIGRLEAERKACAKQLREARAEIARLRGRD